MINIGSKQILIFLLVLISGILLYRLIQYRKKQHFIGGETTNFFGGFNGWTGSDDDEKKPRRKRPDSADEHHAQKDDHERLITFPVREPWLKHIQDGEKKIEGRRGSADKSKELVGKEVLFVNSRRKIPVKVVAIRHYPTLDEFMNKEPLAKLLPGIKSKDEALKIYHEFYDDEKIKEAGGMFAMEFELI